MFACFSAFPTIAHQLNPLLNTKAIQLHIPLRDEEILKHTSHESARRSMVYIRLRSTAKVCTCPYTQGAVAPLVATHVPKVSPARLQFVLTGLG